MHRGEQVAQAISTYLAISKRLPVSMDELIGGVQVLRRSAARDPLSGERWRLVRLTDVRLLEFARDRARQRRRAAAERPGTAPLRRPDHEPGAVRARCRAEGPAANGGNRVGSSSSGDGTGPLIGSTSRSEQASVVTYYGIVRHSEWVFTPLFY